MKLTNMRPSKGTWWMWLSVFGLAGGAGAETAGSGSSLVTLELVTGETPRRVVVELDEKRAPQTCANFRNLVESGYYHGILVHRVIPNYLVQMGDPLTREPGKKSLWGTGGPGKTVPAEVGGKHVRGAVAMARLPDSQNPGRASNGSQFYVALDDLSQLDGDYTVFGKVIRGIEHLDYVSQLTADTNDVPVSRVEIRRTVLGSELSDSPGLAGRAVRPVAAAAEGLKDVSKAVSGSLPLLGGKDGDKPVPGEPAPLAPSAAASADAVGAPSPGEAAHPEGEGDSKWPLLSKLAPSNLSILGRKKEEGAGAAGEVVSDAVPAVPLGAEGESAEAERKRLLPFGHKGKAGEAAGEGTVGGGTSKKTAPAGGTAKDGDKDKEKEKAKSKPKPKDKEKDQPASRKDDREPAEGEKKGFLGRMLDKVR